MPNSYKISDNKNVINNKSTGVKKIIIMFLNYFCKMPLVEMLNELDDSNEWSKLILFKLPIITTKQNYITTR